MYQDKQNQAPSLVQRSLMWGLNALFLYSSFLLYQQQEYSFAILMLLVTCSGTCIYLNPRLYVYRYIFPALAGLLIFVIFPMLYTLGVSFTNYSSDNLLSYQRAKQYLMQSTYLSEQGKYDFKLIEAEQGYRIWLQSVSDKKVFITPIIPLTQTTPYQHELEPTTSVFTSFAPVKEAIAHRDSLNALTLLLPDGTGLQKLGFRHFAAIVPLYVAIDDTHLQNQQTGQLYQANFERGFFEDADSNTIAPGFTVSNGFANYVRIFTHDGIRQPFFQIFVWTLVFASLTVLITLAIGMVLACLVSWEPIKGKAWYRMMLIVPYAVPAFISILIFRGLFNQAEGEINKILEVLLNIRPDWFSDPLSAKTMILIVNAWLGYPYMMILCLGLLQSIPKDLYESSAMEGAGVLTNFFKITLPLILKPMLPLLIASFAFNFNNFVLISLLTGGGPDIIGAQTPAGTTDLLVSYTYRIAFEGDKRDMALAASIATLIFILVAGLSYLHLRLTKIKITN